MTKVLVVDNQGAARQTIVDILSSAKYETTEAFDGGTVVKKAIAERPDLILMDVDLPVMNGLDVLKRLREHPEFSDTPVIMMAEDNNPAKRQVQAWGLGVRHYIIKPTQFDLVELSVKVTLRESDSSLKATNVNKISTPEAGSFDADHEPHAA